LDKSRTLCVMGTFDSQANQKVSRIKDRLKNQGISIDTYEPHVTFGIYTGLKEESLLQWIRKIASQYNSIHICFNHFGFFPDARLCFLAPGSSYSLMDIHSTIHEKFDNNCVDNGCLYALKQSNWVPHMTIASIEQGQEKILLSTLFKNFIPFEAEITKLKMTSSDMSEDIGAFELIRSK